MIFFPDCIGRDFSTFYFVWSAAIGVKLRNDCHKNTVFQTKQFKYELELPPWNHDETLVESELS